MSNNDSLEIGRMLYQLQDRLSSIKNSLGNLDTSYVPQVSSISNKVESVENTLKEKTEALLHNILNSEAPPEIRQKESKPLLQSAGRMQFRSPKTDYVPKTSLAQKYHTFKGKVPSTEEDLPSISEDDISKGMLNLINQGIIPKDVDLTPAFVRGAPPLTNKQMPIYSASEKPQSVQYKTNVKPTHSIKFDFPAIQYFPYDTYKSNNEIPEVDEVSVVSEPHLSLEQAEAEVRGYEELIDEYSSHLFIIRKGKTLIETPEFISYKRTYSTDWDLISVAISYMEKFLSRFAVPRAEIDGKKLRELMGKKSKEIELFSCIVNQDEVRPYIRVPEITYSGEIGRHHAAVKIQSAWRRYKTFSAYTQLKFLMKNVRVIQRAIKNFLMLKNTRREAALQFKSKMDAWKDMQEQFKVNWPSIKNKPRIEIHVSSLSIDESRRLTMEKYLVRQNLQISRIFNVQDPNVKVIYVSAFDLSSEIVTYYSKVLEIGDIQEPANRLTIVSPNIGDNIPTHVSTTRAVLYSPPTIRRLKQLIRHNVAYIVPGHMSKDEVELSWILQAPVMGGDPHKSALYSTKSGSKRVFTAAEVPIPPGAYDIYDEKEFMATLTRLIANNLYVDTWLFKIDNEFLGRGHAYFDVYNLKLVKSFRRTDGPLDEQQQEKLYYYISKALPKTVKICTSSLYQTWRDYMKEFVRVGGVIEATPSAPYKSIGSVTVSFIIQPNGEISVIGAYNKLECRRYITCGYTFPQTHLPNMNMKLLCSSIGASLFEKDIFGYVSIDLVSFPDESKKSSHPLFWGVDIDCSMSNVASASLFYDFLMAGRMDSITGHYYVDEMPNARQFLYIPYIHHPDIGKVLYKTFFYMCRVQGISFDLEDRKGTAFVLPDSIQSSVFGLLTIGKNFKACFKFMHEALDFVAAQGATPLVKISIREDFRDDAVTFTEILSVVKIHEKNLNKIVRK